MSYKYDLIMVGIYSSPYETLEECKEARKEYINYLNLTEHVNLRPHNSKIIEE